MDNATGSTHSGTGPSLEPETQTAMSVGRNDGAAAESTSNRLTLAYPPTEKDGETRYAAVPFPASYQAAVIVALKILGKYMTDPREEKVILRSSTKNRKKEWVWADIDPDNWLFMVQLHGAEVGVFEKPPFLGGKLYITLGQTMEPKQLGQALIER
ncbi:hypothetical protein B0H10DRAFT_1944412 [Mycena sp. CBHHK59/15]|nr:hypothetical protein B0H10DRAFT_1944412 [Mycena sp. CBHHK59/15]